jgi:hypothetical protein
MAPRTRSQRRTQRRTRSQRRTQRRTRSQRRTRTRSQYGGGCPPGKREVSGVDGMICV